MDIAQIIKQLTDKFGNNFDVAKVTEFIKGIDYKNLNLEDIVTKLTASGLLNGSIADTIKEQGASMLGKTLGGIFGGK